MRKRIPPRVWLGSIALGLLAALSFYTLATSSAAASGEEVALSAQYAQETTTSSTSTTIDKVRDVPVPSGNINASGGSLGPSTILLASVLLGIVIVGSMITGGTFAGGSASENAGE